MTAGKLNTVAFAFANATDALLDTQDLARWTIRVSVACYVVSVTARLHGRHRIATRPIVMLWVTGCVFYLVHMLLAFHAFHDWSHRDATRFTAEETYRMTGIRRGDGIWVNYLFAVVWIADCFRLDNSRRRFVATSRRVDAAITIFFALMMFSATVVFGPPLYRVLFVPLALLWGFLLLFHRRFHPEKPSDEEN